MWEENTHITRWWSQFSWSVTSRCNCSKNAKVKNWFPYLYIDLKITPARTQVCSCVSDHLVITLVPNAANSCCHTWKLKILKHLARKPFCLLNAHEKWSAGRSFDCVNEMRTLTNRVCGDFPLSQPPPAFQLDSNHHRPPHTRTHTHPYTFKA